MEDVQNELNQDDSNEGMEAVQGDDEASGDAESKESASKDDPHGVKKRLGMQAKRHQKEMRALQEQIARMQQHFSSQPSSEYSQHGQPQAPTDSEEARIQKAVRYALEAKDFEARKADEAQRQAHVTKQYQKLHADFDKASDKYDDFDEVVRGDDVPFTSTMRDALLLIRNPADVAYQLGKKRTELERIAKLHPLDQAREINDLSFALMSGNKGKNDSSSSSKNPIGSMKPMPNTSNVATNAAAIRQRMKAGDWK